MLKLGIDPEKLYRATFIRQYGLCCCNMALVSFQLFCKNLGHLREFFWANGLPPPLAKNFPYAYGQRLKCSKVAKKLLLYFESCRIVAIFLLVCKWSWFIAVPSLAIWAFSVVGRFAPSLNFSFLNRPIGLHQWQCCPPSWKTFHVIPRTSWTGVQNQAGIGNCEKSKK